MVNDVYIGHMPILSVSAIIAMADLSPAHRYFFATMNGMSVGERIKQVRKERGMSQAELGEALGVRQSVVSEMEAGKLKNWPLHATKLVKLLGKPRSFFEPDADEGGMHPDLPPSDPTTDYVEVAILPTFAGMGGGGTGDADPGVALVPRRLITDEFRGRPTDFLMIHVRGNSMEPLFFHGDELLIDQRDTNPIQGGPFALLYDDGYVVKNIQRRQGKYRLWSSNKDFEDEEWDPADDRLKIMGRPVWFARRL